MITKKALIDALYELQKNNWEDTSKERDRTHEDLHRAPIDFPYFLPGLSRAYLYGYWLGNLRGRMRSQVLIDKFIRCKVRGLPENETYATL